MMLAGGLGFEESGRRDMGVGVNLEIRLRCAMRGLGFVFCEVALRRVWGLFEE